MFNRKLFAACLNGDTDELAALLVDGPDVNVRVRDGTGRTPLYMASRRGHANVVTMLLDAGAFVNVPERTGITPLFVSCSQGHSEVASVLLTAGATTESGLLLLASRGGHANIVTMLLGAGAAINQAHDGMTSLYMACSQGHSEVVSILLAAGAITESDPVLVPMVAACQRGHLVCAQLLSSYGAARHRTNENTHCFLFMTVAARLSSESSARRRYSALCNWIIASRLWTTPLHHLEVIDAKRGRELLRAGADVEATSEGGPSPLSLARELRDQGGAGEGTVAWLVLQAAGPWSRDTHALFPPAARALAEALMVLGHNLSREPRFAGQVGAFLDAWLDIVMPRVVLRCA